MHLLWRGAIKHVRFLLLRLVVGNNPVIFSVCVHVFVCVCLAVKTNFTGYNILKNENDIMLASLVGKAG